jgi:hypothetical protein
MGGGAAGNSIRDTWQPYAAVHGHSLMSLGMDAGPDQLGGIASQFSCVMKR